MNKKIKEEWKKIESDLKSVFPEDKVKFRVGATTKDKKKAIAFAYIDARDVEKRLDDVFGIGGWQVNYTHVTKELIVASIGALVHVGEDKYEWVWKSNGAGYTDIEGEKGGLSDALKRAASVWGVGRYLYFVDMGWHEIDQYKQFKKKPQLPVWARPKKEGKK